MIKLWFKGLEKREQTLVMLAAVAIIIYLIFGVGYQGLKKGHDRSLRQYEDQTKTLDWMRTNVPLIQTLKRSTPTANIAGMSLAQLAEQAAKKANIRIARFQPKDDNEAQVWIERETFKNILLFLNTIELEDGLVLKDVAITTANAPGVVNLRLQFAK